jgi:DNA helicase-2/ATP-dependent DNA helicase PcrA
MQTVDLHLSGEQRAVVDSEHPAIVVIASAGTGKTEVVAQRIERILTDAARTTARVLAVSYTNKAATELQQRFDRRLGDTARRVDVHTLHAFAHNLLRRDGHWIGLPSEPEILGRDEDRVELLGDWLADHGCARGADELKAELQRIDQDRARALPPSSDLAEDWDLAMEAMGALDYPAILSRATELASLSLVRDRIRTLYVEIVVDEAQNLTEAQYRLLTEAIGPPPIIRPAVALFGDDKQSIVGFAGAERTLMERFAKSYAAERYSLTTNFRSAERIARLADAVCEALDRDPGERGRTFAAEGRVRVCTCRDELQEGSTVSDWIEQLCSEGLPPEILGADEHTSIGLSEIAVLGRSRAALRSVELALHARGVKYTTAATLDTLLITDYGRTVLEILALKAADHIAPRWQLARLLEVDRAAVNDLEVLGDHLRSREDDFAALSSIAGLNSPEELPGALAEVEIVDDPHWTGDVLQLSDAWRMFSRLNDRAAWTWGNFRVFLTRTQRSNDAVEGVRLLTVHKAQGREFRAVAIVGLNDGQMPDFRARSDKDRREELSNFYVAVSRPSRDLLLTRARYRKTRYGSRYQDESPYLDIVRKALPEVSSS